MAKNIKYKFLSAEINNGTEENPVIEQVILDITITCATQEIFDMNYPIAEKEAYGEIIVEGEFDEIPEPTPTDEFSIWEELDQAYQQGVNSL